MFHPYLQQFHFSEGDINRLALQHNVTADDILSILHGAPCKPNLQAHILAYCNRHKGGWAHAALSTPRPGKGKWFFVYPTTRTPEEQRQATTLALQACLPYRATHLNANQSRPRPTFVHDFDFGE